MSTATQIIQYNRPKQTQGRGDKYLTDAAEELARRMRKAAHGFAGTDCRLPDAGWSNLSPTVIEWGEDIHNDLGLWRAVEQHQQQCFGTALPLVLAPGVPDSPQGFDPRRIRFLVWNLWPEFDPGVVLSPADADLVRLSEVCAQYLEERFARLPKDSGIGRLLGQPNHFGWDVKMKLAWLGCNSYLFRWSFFWATRAEPGEDQVLKTDEFLTCFDSCWSGLGVVDVLAAALKLTDGERADLKAWHERHLSMYRMLEMEESGGYVRRVVARNLVNSQNYTIRLEQPLADCPFVPGRIVVGWLVPWRGEWFWSGKQRIQDELSPETEDPKLREEAITALGRFVYRYCPAELAKAREVARKMHEDFVGLYGSDLKVFPDGKAAEAAEQKRLERWRTAHTELLGLPPGETKPFKLPQYFMETSQGVAAFSSPQDGVEYARQFDLIQSGLAKKGVGLSAEEEKALRGFFNAPQISPEFANRLIAEHGAASIAEAFNIHDYPTDTAVAFLLRRRRGQFHRTRYPDLSP
jgi:Protein of unknown function (DUF3843)